MKFQELKLILTRLYKEYIIKHLSKILLALVLSIIVAGSTSAIAWLLDPAVKKVFIDQNTTLAWLIPLAIIFAFSAKGLSLYFARINIIRVGQEIAGTTVTASNVIAQLGSIVDAIPSSLYGSEDLKIYVSQDIARAYVRALGGFSVAATSNAGVGSQGTQWWNGGALSFDGVSIAIANGLADSTAIAAEKSNLFFGTGILNDTNLVKVLDMSDLDGSDNVRVIMKMTGGVQYAIAEDITTYGITNSAN